MLKAFVVSAGLKFAIFDTHVLPEFSLQFKLNIEIVAIVTL